MAKKIHLIPKKKPFSKKEKAVNIKAVKEIINEIVITIVPQSFTMFAHLPATKT